MKALQEFERAGYLVLEKARQGDKVRLPSIIRRTSRFDPIRQAVLEAQRAKLKTDATMAPRMKWNGSPLFEPQQVRWVDERYSALCNTFGDESIQEFNRKLERARQLISEYELWLGEDNYSETLSSGNQRRCVIAANYVPVWSLKKKRGMVTGRIGDYSSYNYAMISPEERRQIKLAHTSGKLSPVCEFDYSGSHPNLLLALNGHDTIPNLYDVILGRNGWPADAKPLVKAALLRIFNNDSMYRFSQAMRGHKPGARKKERRRARRRRVLMKRLGLTPKDLFHGIAGVLPQIKDYFLKPETGLVLMRIESQIIIDALYWLALKGIPALPEHDGLIGPVEYENEIKEAMEFSFENRTGKSIRVEREY